MKRSKKYDEAEKKAQEENKKLLEAVRLLAEEKGEGIGTMDNICFMGEKLDDYAVKGHEPLGQKMFLIKKHVRHLPKLFKLMPKITDFKVVKLQTKLMLEIASEWTRRNIDRERAVQEHRRAVNPDDGFDSHGFPKLGYEAMIIAATIMEADSFYDTSFVDLWLTALSIHETCDLNWSKHKARCNKCNVDMTFATVMEDKGGLNWLTFVCPTCQASFSHSRELYINELLHMWAMNEYVNHDTFIMRDHVEKEHPGILKDHGYPDPIKGCGKCKEIHKAREQKIKDRDVLQNKYHQLFHQLFRVANPFTGEVYAKKEKAKSKAQLKAEELKAKRKKKKKGAK